MDQLTKCNVKGVSSRDELAENETQLHSSLQLSGAFQLILAHYFGDFGPRLLCYGSVSLLSQVSSSKQLFSVEML